MYPRRMSTIGNGDTDTGGPLGATSQASLYTLLTMNR